MSSHVDDCNAFLVGVPKVTTDKIQRVMKWTLQLMWSLADTSSTDACRGYYTLNCNDSTCPSESRTGCIMVHHGAQYLFDLCLPLSDVTSRQHLRSVRDTSCKRTANGLSLLLALQPGTHCLTIWEIRMSPETASTDFENICLLCTRAAQIND